MTGILIIIQIFLGLLLIPALLATIYSGFLIVVCFSEFIEIIKEKINFYKRTKKK